jgi:hypothetical protein
VTKCLELAQSCKNEKPTERPNIEDIIRTLNNEMENTGRHISDGNGSTVEQVSSYAHLNLETLRFYRPAANHLKRSV